MSLQAMFDRPGPIPPPRPAPFLRARAKEERNFFPTTSVQDVHVPSEVVDALLHLFQHRCRRVRVRARRTPRVPPHTEGRLDVMLHLLQLRPSLRLDGNAIGAASAHHPAVGWLWK